MIAVLGAGAWGTALACAFARTGRPVRLWGRDPAAMAALAAARENRAVLPGVALPGALEVTAVAGAALAGAAIVVIAVPTQALRGLFDAGLPLPPAVPLVLCAKGIEQDTGLFPSAVAAACRPDNPAAILSGPSFAADVGRGRPTAVTVAAATLGEAEALGSGLGAPGLRLYHTDDRRGVEIGGAAKNVLAIACGIARGLDLGPSAEAALIARSFAELVRFGRTLGARAETLAGLSGLGDLVLTCGSERSRNFAFGMALGRGAHPAARAGGVVEGVATAPVLATLAERAGVDMPVCASVAAVLAGRLDVADAVAQLMARPFRPE